MTPETYPTQTRYLWLSGMLLAACAAGAQAEETMLPEVSVFADSDSRELRRNTSTAKIVFEREELETLDAASIGELLGKLPGTGMFGDPDSKRGKGKGADRNMPQILVDGQPLPGGERNPGSALRLPVDLIERVEIMRNGTAEFPVAGPGGVINLVLRDVPPKSLKSGRLAFGGSDGAGLLRAEGQIGERTGDFGYLLAGAANSQPANGQRQTEIQHFTAGARDEWSFEQAEQGGRDNDLSFAPRFNWSPGNGQSFVLSPFLSHSEGERQTRIARSAYADPVAGTGLAASGHDDEQEQSRRSSGRLAAEWKTIQPGSGELSARLTLQGEHESRRKNTAKFDTVGALASSSAEVTGRNEREGGLALRGKRLLGGVHLASGGAEWRLKSSDETRERQANGSPLAGGADASTALDEQRQVLWVQDEWQLTEQHLLTPGLRWQQQRNRITDGVGARIEQRHVSLDPSLHYLWQPGPAWNLRGSIALSGKPPNPRELSPAIKTASGVNSSGNPDKTGNPQLGAERNLSVEIGAEHFLSDRAGTVGLSLFQRRIDNQVQKLIQFEGGRWVERPHNVGDALLTGALFDFKLRADAFGLPALTLRGNAAYTDTRLSNAVTGLGAGEGPRKSANLGADYQIASLRLTLGGNYSWTSALDRESSATVRQTQGARRQFDLYALHKLDRQFSLRFSAQNATSADRHDDLQELDGSGSLLRLEQGGETTKPTLFFTLEGKF
jgi:iron complex outermembrane receptor protein